MPTVKPLPLPPPSPSGSFTKMVAWGLINPSVPPDQMIGTFLAMSSMVSPDFSAISN